MMFLLQTITSLAAFRSQFNEPSTSSLSFAPKIVAEDIFGESLKEQFHISLVFFHTFPLQNPLLCLCSSFVCVETSTISPKPEPSLALFLCARLGNASSLFLSFSILVYFLVSFFFTIYIHDFFKSFFKPRTLIGASEVKLSCFSFFFIVNALLCFLASFFNFSIFCLLLFRSSLKVLKHLVVAGFEVHD